MKKVDALPIRGLYKLQIYERYVTACLRFDLAVHDVSESRLENLDRTVRKFARKWCSMPPSTHVGMLFHSSGLNLTEPSHMYREGHVSLFMSAKGSDPYLAEAVSTQTPGTHSAQHQAVTDIAHAARNSKQAKEINKAVKDSIHEDLASDLKKQNDWKHVLCLCDSDVKWKACISGLSEPTFAFVMRAISDSLPSNSNLKLWNKLVSAQCKACGNSNQTVHHILNNCPSHLNLYSWRHDNVLLLLKTFLTSHIRDKEVKVDLVTTESIILESNVETVPCDIYPTVLRPDIVIIDRSCKQITIIELTIPFERNFQDAQRRKTEKYSTLVAGLEEVGFQCCFYSLEVGSRGVVSNGATKFFKNISGASRSEVKRLLTSVSQVAIKCSYVIFKERDNANAKYVNIM